MTRAWWLVCALALSACTNVHKVGSTCEDGICETASTSTPVPCVFSTGTPIMSASPEGSGLDEVCLNDSVHKNDSGMVPCRLFFSLADRSVRCESMGFTTIQGIGPVDSNICELPQLEQGERTGAALGSATGWYVEGPQLPDVDPCRDVGVQRLVLNGQLPVDGTTWLSCGEAFADPEDVAPALMGDEVQLVDPIDCGGLPPLPKLTPDDIGALCSAHVRPPLGFYTDRSYVDVRSEQCTSGVCLVDAAQSATLWPCPEGFMCDEPALEELTYCSCRCDAGDNDSRVPCACPTGFSCVQQLASQLVPAGVAGGYCAKDIAL